MDKHLYKIPAILYSIMIFLLSSMPQNRIPRVEIFGFDKIVHFCEYTIYALTLMLAYTRAKRPAIYKNAFVVSVITGAVYAASDEFHQLFVAGRDCSLVDFTADTLGLILGAYLFTRIVKYRNPDDELVFRKTSHK